MEEKYCSRCKITKPISDFSRWKYGKDNLFYMCKDCNRIYHKEYEKLNPRLEHNKNIHKIYRKKRNARASLQQAVKVGKIIRERCLICSDITTEAHHFDYEYPLKVLWLCRKHHVYLHVINRRIEKLTAI